MLIREATVLDISEILEVLKASLGETSSKKTESVWRYKHVDNPFGKSLVLVATENGKIIGVRAFMRWKWQKGEQLYSAFRAVDTATHPDHQGKGVFKKLTLKALKIGRERGDHFVFNTPNSQSKPGYLKLGWEGIGRLKVQVRPLNLLKFKNDTIEFRLSDEITVVSNLLNSNHDFLKESGKLFTPKDLDYINWRYLNNPLQKYHIVYDSDFFIAGYLKERKNFSEFRISEAITSEKGKIQAKSAILNLAKSSTANFLSLSPNSGIQFKIGITEKIGPVLTYKPINLTQPEFTDLNTWNYSLGDLELF
jgi:predicted N-acetyltransferase YhbS